MRKSEAERTAAVAAALALFVLLAPAAVIRPRQTAREERETRVETAAAGDTRTVRVQKGERVEEMALSDYLFGVLAAEMPASFEEEALKAQCVAARTYTLYKIENGSNHAPDADICTDPGCCQAYREEAEAREEWGAEAEAYAQKLRGAIAETADEVILYEGAPILAAFHASCAGVTRAAGEVWAEDLPYLRPVSSPEEGAEIPNYYSREEFTLEEFRQKIGAACPNAVLGGGAEGWLRDAVTDAGGSVETVRVGGVTLKGSRLRAILGLRSACFTWAIEDGKIVFFVTGSGHGVGMSQYGAREMARQGADYRTILTHYYTGVRVERMPFTKGGET
ncbi:MAG: stage II sporulation protein D [Oscillibacter sp.]|nr:stage II sporulation protein D [Oscillibacter sp.]